MKVTPYHHPGNTNVVFWDLPGVGTDNFPKETYLSTINFEKYDFFIVVSSTRFTKNDTWLVNNILDQMKKIQGRAKPGGFYFVRTKMDNEVSNMQRNNPTRNFTSEEIVENIQTNALKKLKSLGAENPDLFLIDSLDQSKYDFGKLCSRLVHDAVGSKMEAIAYTLFIRTRETFNVKKEQLQKRILKKALAIAFAEAFPVFGYDHRKLFLDEEQFYREQFHVTDTDINTLARFLNKDALKLRKELKLSPEHVDENEVPMELIELAKKTLETYLPRIAYFLKLAMHAPKLYNRFCCLTAALVNAYNDAIALNEVYQQNLGQKARDYVMLNSKL